MNEKVYIIVKVSRDCPTLDYYLGNPTNDFEVCVEALVGVFNTYEAANNAKKCIKLKPWESFYIIERLVGRIHTPHKFRSYIGGPPVEPDWDDEDDDDE